MMFSSPIRPFLFVWLTVLAGVVSVSFSPACAQNVPPPAAQELMPPSPDARPPSESTTGTKIIQDLVPEKATSPVAAQVPPPIQQQAIAPAPVASVPVPSNKTGVESAAKEGEQFDENLFFDAESLVPEGEVSKKDAPSKVNPRVSPASRLVIVSKGASAKSTKARLTAAERALKLGRYESALEIYDGLYKSNKRDPNILLGRAITLQNLGRDDDAIRAYEDLLVLRPKNIDAQINMNGLIGKQYPAVALRKLLALYEKNPGNVAIVAQISVIEAKMGHHEEALRYLGTAASMEPRNANHIFNMAVIADRAGDKKRAVKYYEEALEVDTLYGSGRTIPRESVFSRLAQLR